MAENGELNEPVMTGSDDASNDDKMVGIVAQIRQDHAGDELSAVRGYIHQRFAQAGITADESVLDRLAREVSEAPAG